MKEAWIDSILFYAIFGMCFYQCKAILWSTQLVRKYSFIQKPVREFFTSFRARTSLFCCAKRAERFLNIWKAIRTRIVVFYHLKIWDSNRSWPEKTLKRRNANSMRIQKQEIKLSNRFWPNVKHREKFPAFAGQDWTMVSSCDFWESLNLILIKLSIDSRNILSFRRNGPSFMGILVLEWRKQLAFKWFHIQVSSTFTGNWSLRAYAGKGRERSKHHSFPFVEMGFHEIYCPRSISRCSFSLGIYASRVSSILVISRF